MTTPSYQPAADTTAYVDLRVFDRTDQDVFNGALAAIQANMPDWVPREGHTEVMLLEALALEMAEGIVAVNRIPGAVLETLLQLFTVYKDYGAAPTALATVNVADSVGHTVPAGTRMYVSTIDGTGVVTLLVEPPDLIIPAGSNQGVVSLIGDAFTDAANGASIGTQLQLASPVAFIDSIVLASEVTEGRSAETDDQWRDRGVQRLARLSATLVTPAQFEAAALEHPEVDRVIAVDNTDPTTSGVGDDPGHVTVAVLGPGGSLISTPTKLLIEQSLEDQAVSVLDVHVTDISIQTVTLSVVVTLAYAISAQSVSDGVLAAILTYIDPTRWSYGTTIYRNELISLVDQVEGVDRVVSVTLTGANGAGDLPLNTASTVPRATAQTVTVSIQA